MLRLLAISGFRNHTGAWQQRIHWPAVSCVVSFLTLHLALTFFKKIHPFQRRDYIYIYIHIYIIIHVYMLYIYKYSIFFCMDLLKPKNLHKPSPLFIGLRIHLSSSFAKGSKERRNLKPAAAGRFFRLTQHFSRGNLCGENGWIVG